MRLPFRLIGGVLVATLLTLIVLIAAMLSTGQGLTAIAQHWGNGFWSLLQFSMQMVTLLQLFQSLAHLNA